MKRGHCTLWQGRCGVPVHTVRAQLKKNAYLGSSEIANALETMRYADIVNLEYGTVVDEVVESTLNQRILIVLW